MPYYRRAYIPGSTVFLTLVTYRRRLLFDSSENIERLRQAVRQTKNEADFAIAAAVILPDHLHFIWTLPPADSNYSKRVGRIKVLFTRALKGQNTRPTVLSPSRRKHRESDVWQRRFWEHTIRSEAELSRCLDYVHYNPVKHGLVDCPHQWRYSSFHKLVGEGVYRRDWACRCSGSRASFRWFDEVGLCFGE
ncbi:transposase [Oscillatoria sp. CS-180]|uniref:REP-associated tyrosine transposase n=1 Tax=Oscillatoria sp. CS-180 TaxID=3021720 RepID=UPI0023313336|nr:transposase [Oscillatoria sp. CS-180]MDB9526929.1 transposase [Oscillatoria sp. CS-180]